MSTAAAHIALPHAAAAAPHVIIATLNRAQGSTGVHTHTAVLQSGLAAAGVDCDIVTAFDRGPHWLGLFAVRKLLDRVRPSSSITWYRYWHARALHASLLHWWNSNAEKHYSLQLIAQCPVSARVSMNVRQQLGASFPVTLVCHFNHSEAQEYRDLGQLPRDDAYADMLDFEADVLRSVDQVVYVSDWAWRIVEIDRRIKPKKSSVIHNGIDATVDVAPLQRSHIGLSPADTVLMNVGTLEARKNQLGLLDLFAAIVRRRPEARLVLVGDGNDRTAIESRCAALAITGRVTLLGHRRDVASLLPLASMYVHYATAENCPIVLLEAARARLPWAAVSAAGVVELQRELGGCVELNPANVDESARRVLSALDDASTLNRMGDTAGHNFKRSFTREAMVNAYLAALGVTA